MAPSQLLSSAGIPSNLVASCIFLLTLVFLSGSSVLGMRPLSELSGADKATLAQAALQRATIFRTRNGAERRLLANSFVAATDALGLATTLVGANSLLTVDASSVVYTGATSASGIFQLDASHALNSEYGISSGVVLTCGSGELSIATDNDIESSSTSNNVPGDSLLDLINNGATNDASVLDFKGTAQGNGQLTFQYVFGSEEYLEYVGSFNDVFALFVKVGNGDFTPSDNVALASDGKAVSIDNVNPNSNAAQYVDNPAADGTHAIAYDGYTKLLTTAPISVSTGDIVHIRLAIADALDTALDSVVYVVGKSIVIAPTPGPTTLTPAPTTLAPTTTPAPTTPAPTTPPPTISKCSDLCNTASSAPNRCCNSEGSLGICCPGLCGLSTPNSDGTTNPTCLGGGGATPAPTTSAPTTPAPSTTPAPTTSAPTATPAPTTSAPTTPAPTTPAPSTTPAPTTSAPTATPGSTTSAPTTPAPTTPAPTTAPTPTPTGALQSCTSDFCNPYGALPNKCCDAFGVTMRCCPGQCGPNIVNDGVSTPTCM